MPVLRFNANHSPSLVGFVRKAFLSRILVFTALLEARFSHAMVAKDSGPPSCFRTTWDVWRSALLDDRVSGFKHHLLTYAKTVIHLPSCSGSAKQMIVRSLIARKYQRGKEGACCYDAMDRNIRPSGKTRPPIGIPRLTSITI